MYNILSPLDQFVIKENRVPNDNERQKIENYYFSSLNFTKITKTNFLLEKSSRELKIQYYNFFDKLCMKKNENYILMIMDIYPLKEKYFFQAKLKI